jgi:hypothetical protein
MFALLLGVLLVAAGLAVAQAPKQTVSGARHPNLAAAQRFCQQAFEKVSAAQQANEWDMQGHAAKAKDLLNQANTELKAAAGAANKNAK